jgi:predicted ATPase/serine/threonine protein kinase
MLPAGTHLGRYTVREHLGAGGMGDVYLALDPNLGRTVAVKVLPDALAADSDRLARFVREARAVSALNHPNILTVFDFDRAGATHFLVTEFVDGRTLREWRDTVRPLLVEVLDVVAQAASALHAAHEAGIVHRDVKPENLMLRRDGLVKVLDFGIAKLAAGSFVGPDHAARTDPQLQTQSGTILGTTRYMSPEQALGAAVDARTDVWSLGVVLYELVAGRAPFAGPTPMGTLAMIMGREPEPLDAAAPGTPEAVCRIVARALRKQPDQRFQSAAEMAGELTRAARELRHGTGRATGQHEVATPPLVAVAAPASGERPSAPAPTNLPTRSSALVGRSRELSEITAMLRTADARLLTLTGPGGTGKTRLAVEAARGLCGEFADGVFGVDLSTLSDPELLAAHIAEAFRLKEAGDRSLATELELHLADKHLLLLLDNFEHLLAGAPFVSRLLLAAPRLTVLATSRALLRLSQEREYAVEPLEVPVFSSLPPLEELASAPAVALFVERAREARPSFALTAENARAVVEVCRRLDGLPLALELAAARVKLLAPASILERLDQRLKLLTGGARDLPSRQQTMRGAVAWSYELLGEGERAVLRRVAVFAGGFSLEAAEAVCGSGTIDVLDTVGSLVDKSLLRQRELGDGEVRFTMLEVVREYALEQLEASGEAGDARLEHARYFRQFAQGAGAKLGSADQGVWVERLAREIDNLKAALAVMLDREPDEGAAFAADLYTYWDVRRHHTEARVWLTRALERATVPALRSRLLSFLSLWETFLGNLGSAASHAREAVEAGRASGDPRALAYALRILGEALLDGDDLSGAVAAIEEGLAITRETGGGSLEGRFLGSLGQAARRAGDMPAARASFERALEVSGRHVRSTGNAVHLYRLACVSLEEGDVACAARYFREVLSIAAELGLPRLSPYALDGLAAVALEAGEHERAALLAGAAEALYETAGVPVEPAEQALRERYAAALRASSDAATLEREWARGRAMTLEEAARTALGE